MFTRLRNGSKLYKTDNLYYKVKQTVTTIKFICQLYPRSSALHSSNNLVTYYLKIIKPHSDATEKVKNDLKEKAAKSSKCNRDF